MINKPKQIKQAFAVNGLRNEIPNDTEEEGRVSYNTGFPEITMLPKEAGGLPPLGQDMNGILYDLSENIVYNQAGGTYGLNEDIITNRGGYPKNAMLIEEDNKIYLSKHNNNISNYKTDNSVIGLDWDMIVPNDCHLQRIVGEIFNNNRTDALDGCLKCDGKIYDTKDYSILVNNYLKQLRIKYVSFAEYENILINNNNSCYYFGYEMDKDIFRVPTINTGIQFYNALVVVSDVYGTPIIRKRNDDDNGSDAMKLVEQFSITKPIKYLEIKNIDNSNYRHKITIADLKSDTTTSSRLYCQISCDNSYVTDNLYYWSNNVFNSNESYDYIKNKNKANNYQLSSEKYLDAGVSSNGSAYIELDILDKIAPNNLLKSNMIRFYLDTSDSRKLYNTTNSSCYVYSENIIDGIRLYLDNDHNITEGYVKHYMIK